MVLQQLDGNTDASRVTEFDEQSFSSERWLAYFEENKQNRTAISFPEGVSISPELCAPLVHSLQRFQIGETGEGKHLRRYASATNDAAYEQCIDLFIKEEQSHARILAEMISALDGELLTWHWTDVVFIGLRRMLHLKTELFILLVAEIIGKCFYKLCANNIQDQRMSVAFSLIVLDEIGHLEFHCAFLRTQTERFSALIRYIVFCLWVGIFYAACTVFIIDHRRTLSALAVSPQAFLHDCGMTFHRAARRVLFTHLTGCGKNQFKF